MKSREELLRIASAGPAAGAAASMALVLLGLGLSVAKAGPLVEVIIPYQTVSSHWISCWN